MDNEMAYMKKHPPRCLEGKAVAPEKYLQSFLISELGDNSTQFSSMCDCGKQVYKITYPAGFGAVFIKCKNCEKNRTLFDPAQHGYDGELGHNDGMGQGNLDEYICPECRNQWFEFAIAFQYSGETDVLDEEDAPDIKPEDLFGWTMVAAKCCNCGDIEEVYQEECA